MAPRVSIGLPVYNGQQFLAEALDSALSQTFTDFELIVSDNASTDDTPAICEAYAAKDDRIRYNRCDHNHGAAWNFNQTFNLARGEYFKCLAADDLMAPEFLSKCIETLDAVEDVILAYPRVNVIDATGKMIRQEVYSYDQMDLRSDSTLDRLRQLLTYLPTISIIFGLIRSSALVKTRLMRTFVGADSCLLVDLVMQGKFVEVPQYLASGRWHEDSYGCKVADLHRQGDREGAEQAQWFDTSNTKKRLAPHWRRLGAHIGSILHAPTNPVAKFRMLLFMVHVANWWRKDLLAELR